jgi:adenosine kinase
MGQLRHPSVLLVGNATQDSVYFVAHLPKNDEVCAVHRHLACLGGRGVVPALVAGALGVDVDLCTVIGADLRREFEGFLNSRDVGTSAVKWDPSGRSTTRYVAFIGEVSGDSLAVAHAPQLDWTPTQTQRKFAAEATAVYFSTNDPGFNLSLLSCVHPREQVVVHNLGVRFENRRDYVEVMLAKATILIGNRVETAKLSETTSMGPQEVLSSSESLEAIIVTQGRDGVLLFERGQREPKTLKTPSVAAVLSPVGAGDALAAGVVARLASGGDLGDALALGVELGALAVQSELSYPDLARVSSLAD